MDNKEKILLKVQNDLKQLAPYIKKASESIINEGVSDYPVFVLHQAGVNIGLPLVEKTHIHSHWSVNASTLEEFMAKSVISPEKIESFRKIFKEPEEFMCLFVLDDNIANFVFHPYEISEEKIFTVK